MNKQEILMPPLIESLIKDTLNTKEDVWRRQNFRNSLAVYRNVIDAAIKKYDAEYEKAMNSREKKKRAS